MEEFSDPANAPTAFRGGPTILIHGLDLDPAARSPAPGPPGLRVFSDPREGSPGLPSDAMFESAFREAGRIQ